MADPVVPLSELQQPWWLIGKLAPGIPAVPGAAAVWLSGRLDQRVLSAALDDVVARHDALRLDVLETDNGPVQADGVGSPGSVDLTWVDGARAADRRRAARALADAVAVEPIRVGLDPLWRIRAYTWDEDEHVLVWAGHGLVADQETGWIVLNDLLSHYTGRLAGVPAAGKGSRYRAFAARQSDVLRGPRLSALLDHWRDRLRDATAPAIVADRSPSDQPSLRIGTHREALGRMIGEEAKRLADRRGTSAFVVHLAALFVLLHRYTGQEDLMVGCPDSLRAGDDATALAGQCTNVLPIRVEVRPDESFSALVDRVDHAVAQARSHAGLPFARLVDLLAPPRRQARVPLVPVSFRQVSVPVAQTPPGLVARFEAIPSAVSAHDLDWQLVEDGDGTTIHLAYRTDLFEAATAAGLSHHLRRVLTEALRAPDRPLRHLVLLDAGESDELLRRWDGPRRDSAGISIDEWFATVVDRSPAAVAVVAGSLRSTFAELDEAANRLAWLLTDHGVQGGDRIGLCLPRGVNHVVAALAVLKIGAAFVPIDPGNPTDRTIGLLAESRPRVVLTTTATAETIRRHGYSALLPLDALGEELRTRRVDRPPRISSPADLAYVLYTSGSTGVPKGVMVEHRNVVNFIESVQRLFDLSPGDRFLGYASYGFDVSIFEMFAALLSGASLHIADEADRLDPDRLQSLLSDRAITVIDLPPAVMALLDPSPLVNLRIAFVGGEAFSGDLVNRWNKVSRFFNGYGPTECTVTMIVEECAGQWSESPPIGLPMDNHVAHVLDADLRLVPYGVPGELVIGGAGLAAGYLGDAELTREKFVEDPFGTASGGRLYRTGDLVRRRRDGALVFLGRVDRQVKLRGIRVEPGEVEAALLACDGVRQAYVEARSGRRGQPYLVAYVGAPDQPRPTPDELRSSLSAELPPALVPQSVVVLAELPLTASGKIDKRALPAEPPARTAGAATVPRTTTERIIAEELMSVVLPGSQADVTAGIFDLGGTSMQAAELVAAAERRFGVDVSFADFFREPTVAALARQVDQERATAWL